jgi:phosphorylcholine metabolism protein LicD
MQHHVTENHQEEIFSNMFLLTYLTQHENCAVLFIKKSKKKKSIYKSFFRELAGDLRVIY